MFLAASTIGEEDGRVPRILLYIIALIGIGTLNICFYSIQRLYEKRFQNMELTFSSKYAEMERFINGEDKKDDKIIEEEEENIEDEESST